MDQLFLISYRGTITTLRLHHDAPTEDALREVVSTRSCEPNPSWISLDAGRRILYCTEGGMASGKGALKALRIGSDGSLTELSSVETPKGAAHHVQYNNGNAMVVAYYYAGYVGTYDITDPSRVKTLQEMTFDFDSPGPGPAQDQPRPHHTAVDPTGRFILSADLGADLIRVFGISLDHHIEEIQGLKLERGDHPRHVAFVTLQDRVQLYILLQDTNAILTYRVEYPESGGMSFSKEDRLPLLRAADGSAINFKDGVHLKASHLAISPDNKFLLASLRYDSSHTIPSPLDPRASIPSDTLFSYSIDPATGALSEVEAAPSGGRVPRQFSLNAAGDKIAIVSQRDGWLSIFERDVATGKLGRLLGVKDGFGAGPDDMGPVCVLWDSREA